jgi:hypothetical protein
VQQGIEVVAAIQGVKTDENDNPVEPVIIEDVIVSNELQPGLNVVE